MERDGQLSMHVLRMHQYIPQGLEKGQPIPEQPLKIYAPDEPDAQDADKSIYEKFNPLIHGAERRQATKDVLRLDFLKKYISYAKNNVKPTLTSEASQLIGDVYSELRQRGAVEGESDRNVRLLMKSSLSAHTSIGATCNPTSAGNINQISYWSCEGPTLRHYRKDRC